MTTHLENYLAYYVGCESPGYAVLITGSWGVGKTFQLKKFLSEDERYYVSLFGLQTADEVYSAVYTQMFPNKAKVKNAAAAVSEAGVEVAGFGSLSLGGIVSGIANAFLRNEVRTDKTLIFDDLERCGLNIKDTLGVINRYVEHHGCRVIVLAHDEKLEAEFLDAKEKLFGQTIAVEPQLEAAFDAFIKPHTALNTFLPQFRQEVINIFKTSDEKSLRILKHVIEDLSRLHLTLTPVHLSNEDAMLELVRVFSALDIEVRRGALKRDDLLSRANARVTYQMRKIGEDDASKLPDKPPIVKATDDYNSIDLESQILDDDCFAKVLIDGSFDADQIQTCLNNFHYFLKASEAPAWRVFINFDEIEDDVAQTAMVKLHTQFEEHEITNTGEMLHLFSLRFMMAEYGLIDHKHDAVKQACKNYIDFQLENHTLEAQPLDWTPRDPISKSYEGVAYWILPSYAKEFREVYMHLVEARKRALQEKLKTLVPDLLEMVAHDGAAFFERTTFTHSGGNIYATVPILSEIEPAVFVDTWTKSHPKNWSYIQTALISRYDNGLLESSLKSEAAWFTEVKKELEREIEKSTGIRKLRLLRSRLLEQE